MLMMMMNMMKNRGNNAAPMNFNLPQMMNPMLKLMQPQNNMMGFPAPGMPMNMGVKTGDQQNDAIIQKVWPALGLKRGSQDEIIDSNSQNTLRSNPEYLRSQYSN